MYSVSMQSENSKVSVYTVYQIHVCFSIMKFCIYRMNLIYTCCSHSGSEDDPDQNNFQKNFTKIIKQDFLKRTWPLDS